MKKTTRWFTLAALLFLGVFSTQNCYGRFVLTGKIYNWNGSMGNKFIKSILMWVLIIIPVYGVCVFIDFIILNTIEFWTGSNPLAMGPTDKEIQIVEKDGRTIELTATQNRFDIKVLKGEDAGKTMALMFNTKEQAWYLQNDKGTFKVAEVSPEDQSKVKLFHPDGQALDITL